MRGLSSLLEIRRGVVPIITAAQLRAARALLGIDQKTLAAMAGVSVPTIRRMEASKGNVRGVIGTLMKVVDALEAAGIELIAEGATSAGGGRGVRLREIATREGDARSGAETGDGR